MAKAIRFEKGTIIAERFRIEEAVDDDCYQAKDTQGGARCALRFLPDGEAPIEPPAHPNIAKVVHAGRDEASGRSFIATEVRDGKDLRTWVTKNALLNKSSIHVLFEQLGSALDAAHAADVVHGGLGTRCLFVNKRIGSEPVLEVRDFGARVGGVGSVGGTTALSAPEQHGKSMRELAADKGFEIASTLSPATDVFSLALLAYEVLTDSDIVDYWGVRDPGDVMTKIVMEAREAPSTRAGLNAMNLPDGFDAWFERCTAHAASQRFQSAGEATAIFVALMKGEKVSIAPPAQPAVAATALAAAATIAQAPHTEVMQPLATQGASTEVMAPLPAPAAAAQTLPAAPAAAVPQSPPAAPTPGFGWEAQQPQPHHAGGGVSGPPNAPPQLASMPAPKRSNAGLIIAVGGLFALIALMVGGGVVAYFMTAPAADTSEALDDDDGSRRRRKPRTPETASPRTLPTAPTPESHDAAPIAVRADDPALGKRDAMVTIVAFSDFECPYCGKVEATMTGLRAKYGDKLRIVWKDFPLAFHKRAEPTHVAARAVYELGGDKAFWAFHERAFANRKDLSEANFEVWAASAGVSLRKFQKLRNDPKMAARVQQNITDGRSYGVKGTPAFYINGRYISGARDQTAFETEIDAELVEAAKLIGGGTPTDQVYVVRTRANFSAPSPTPSPSPSPSSDSTTVWKIPVHKDDPVFGNRDALVTIVVFSEFQCPFCAKVEPTLAKLHADYGAKLRIVWKDNPLPFHKRAVPAAMLAREIYQQQGNAGFWKIHKTLFANQRALEDADLWRYAAGVGANVTAVQDAVRTNKHKAVIDRSQNEASDFKATGTPHFFINGRRLVGAQPESAFKTIIDEEIKNAGRLLATGTSPSDLYDALIKSGKGPDPLERKSVGAPPADAPFKGAKTAKVVVQIFSDFQCPFCSRVNGTLATVLTTYGSDVKLVWRHKPLPFHKDAPLAHEAALEAYTQQGNTGFWKMHDKLFANQKALSRADLESYAGQLGLDMTKFRAALNDRRHRARVDSDAATPGIKGTPNFVINGYFLSGAQPFSKFKKVIDRALSEAP